MVATLAFLAAPFGVTSAIAASPVAKYVALGDSYAAGQGSVGAVVCGNATTGYPVLLGQQPKTNLLRNPSCSGATISDVMSDQLRQVNRGTTLITITAGANDLGASTIYQVCVFAPDSGACSDALSDALHTRLPAALASMTQLIMAAHDRSPNAEIVVTGYPEPFSLAHAAPYPEMPLVNTIVHILNSSLRDVAVDAGAAFAPVDFRGHQFGDSDPWIGVDIGNPVTLLHPNAAGDAAYAAAVRAALP